MGVFIMKNLFEREPLLYWKNRIKLYKARRDSYKFNSNKWRKYDMLLKKAEYQLAMWKYTPKNRCGN